MCKAFVDEVIGTRTVVEKKYEKTNLSEGQSYNFLFPCDISVTYTLESGSMCPGKLYVHIGTVLLKQVVGLTMLMNDCVCKVQSVTDSLTHHISSR